MPSEAAKNCDGEVYNRRTKGSMLFRRETVFKGTVKRIQKRDCSLTDSTVFSRSLRISLDDALQSKSLVPRDSNSAS